MPKKKTLILVVDDDIRMLRMMKRMLELEDFEVQTANCGEAALKIFEKDTPSLVLLDIMMPDMDGYIVCRRIREFSQVPIIMVTARGDDKEKVEGLNIGADDYVTKPFSASELAARVRAVLRRVSSQEIAQEAVFRYRNMTIDFTSGSRPKYSKKSVTVRSHSFPVWMNFPAPSPFANPEESMS